MLKRWKNGAKIPSRVRRGGRAYLAAGLLLLTGCATTVPPGGLGSEADFLHGKKLFDDGRYLQAVQSLEAFRNEHPGSDRVDDAIFLLGTAHQKLGENLLARDEFDRLLRDFPQSKHREDAQYERAMSWLADARPPALAPEASQAALEAFQTYLGNYPQGAHGEEADRYIRVCLDRLAVKAYLNGQTYLMLRYPVAARIYFQKSLRILDDSSRAGDAIMGLARSYERTGDVEKARSAYRQLLDFATPERVRNNGHLRDLRARAEDALSRSQAAAGRSS
jgi:outer membrane assembly lipoprotein YfiO